jgi:rhodanese-related sulfurtransferase
MLKQVTTGSTPQQVWERLLRYEPLFILDVRNRDEFERWRVEGPSVPTLNVPYFELPTQRRGGRHQSVLRGVQAQLMANCRMTGPSRRSAEGNFHPGEELRCLGFDANMEGMEAWGNFTTGARSRRASAFAVPGGAWRAAA